MAHANLNNCNKHLFGNQEHRHSFSANRASIAAGTTERTVTVAPTENRMEGPAIGSSDAATNDTGNVYSDV